MSLKFNSNNVNKLNINSSHLQSLNFDDKLIKGNSTEKNIPTDLGLSVKWATYNLGAKSITDIGKYFKWGDIIGYNELEVKSGLFDKSSISSSLTFDIDPATIILGKNWRTPSKEEYEELLKICKSEVVTINNVKCYKLSNNDHEIYFPCAGWASGNSISDLNSSANYWTSTGKDAGRAYELHSGNTLNDNSKTFGYPIKAVYIK